MKNFARYAFDLPAHGPVAWPTAVGGLTESGADRFLTITFTRRATASDLSYVVESSQDLTHWAPVATVAPGSPASVSVQDATPAAPEAPRRFLRTRAVFDERSSPSRP